MTTIGFIRHGITDWNIEKRDQGQMDIPLNQAGIHQARSLSERLKGESWDFLYASDLSRAKQTAQIIADVLGIQVQTDVRLREIHCGEREGTTLEDRISKWGPHCEAMDLGVETHESVINRGLAAIKDIIESHPDKRILIVSHGTMIELLLTQLIPQQAAEEIKNTALTMITQMNGGWKCVLYNCIEHIG
ncbi:histidine phosphatase family protein [Paenibacillus chungangensis]|uniref:Histidine phosphatase family protein n=1 Tax=Paenibacillus chungangensis TaxID=696535 RepID=A0ABW3HUA5_9BACL